MARSNNMTMSFLDVLCSAMGGMIVLAVIFSVVKNPVPIPKLNEFILLSVDLPGGGSELGMVIQGPQQKRCAVVSGREAEASRVLAASATGGVRSWIVKTAGEDRTRFFVEIREPISGLWVFRPYMLSWAGKGLDEAKIERVEAWTKNGPVKFGAGSQDEALANPGDQSAGTYSVMLR